MAYENVMFKMTIVTAADFSNKKYRAIGMNGAHGNNSETAAGICLENMTEIGGHMPVGYIGEMKFKAGGSISVGDRLTVISNGSFSQMNSGGVGWSKVDIASGGIGTGIFNFATRD